jgi:hypothetical protein
MITNSLDQAHISIERIKKQFNDKKFYAEKAYNDEIFDMLERAEMLFQLVQLDFIILQNQLKEEEQKKEIMNERQAQYEKELAQQEESAELSVIPELEKSIAELNIMLKDVLMEYKNIMSQLDQEIRGLTQSIQQTQQQIYQSMTNSFSHSIQIQPVGSAKRVTSEVPKDKILSVVYDTLDDHISKDKTDYDSLQEDCIQNIQNHEAYDEMQENIQDSFPDMEPEEAKRHADECIINLFDKNDFRELYEKIRRDRERQELCRVYQDVLKEHQKIIELQSKKLKEAVASYHHPAVISAGNNLKHTLKNMQKITHAFRQFEYSHKPIIDGMNRPSRGFN